MQNNMVKHKNTPFAGIKLQLAEVWQHIKKQKVGNFLTVLVLSISLCLPLFFYITWINLSVNIEKIDDGRAINIYLSKKAKVSDMASIKSFFNKNNFGDVNEITPKQGLEFLERTLKMDYSKWINENPLPTLLKVKLSSNVDAISKLQIQDFLSKQKMVDKFSFQENLYQKLAKLKSILNKFILVLSGVMLLSIILVIGNTIRSDVFKRRNEIKIKRLLGATNYYILRPFSLQGLILGFVSSVIALILGFIFVYCVDHYFAGFIREIGFNFYFHNISWQEIIFVLFLGSIIAYIASFLAAARHINDDI